MAHWDGVHVQVTTDGTRGWWQAAGRRPLPSHPASVPTRRHPDLAREQRGGAYDSRPSHTPSDTPDTPEAPDAVDAAVTGTTGAGGATGDVFEALTLAVDAVRARAIDELTDSQLVHELTSLEVVSRQLSARSARATAALGDRQAARAVQARGGDERAGDRARRQAERELAGRLNKSRGEVAGDAKRGRQAGSSSAGRRAFDEGRVPPKQATQLDETLRAIADPAARAEAEAQLLPAAQRLDPTEFGRRCRDLLARLDHEAAVEAEDRRHARRKASTWTTADGMRALHVELAAVDGATVTAAIAAFNRMDAPGEQRSGAQKTADAVVAMASAALRAGEAATEHGEAPHIQVTVDWQTIARNAGVAIVDDEPVPFPHIRRLLADCGVSRLITDPAGLALEAGERVRTVPAGLYRALLERENRCAGDGCDIAPRYCQVMHLGTSFRLGGRLTLKTSAFGCAYHHDKYDRRGWKATWVDGRPVIHHPARPPDSRRSEDADSDQTVIPDLASHGGELMAEREITSSGRKVGASAIEGGIHHPDPSARDAHPPDRDALPFDRNAHPPDLPALGPPDPAHPPGHDARAASDNRHGYDASPSSPGAYQPPNRDVEPLRFDLPPGPEEP